ncbi:hypothetical protein V1478_000090 [Vespula squamosa]|uniref:Uncharacterized protein n=1 Tax=Vespula squamosa TaxID=30214 RepID=A0ABD2C923_VESSQ
MIELKHELVRCDLSLRLVRIVDDQFKISSHLYDSEDIDGVLMSSTNIYVNKRVKQLVLNIYYTGILLFTCQ